MSTSPIDFESWVLANGDALTRFAVLAIGDRTAADDAVQEALSRALPRWQRISATNDPFAYLRRMTINAHVSWWRTARRREALSADRLPERPAPASNDPTHLDLWELCAALPVRQRAAVVLRFYEGLSYAEVAAVLEVSEVTARTQTHRALKTLRTLIDKASQ